MIHISLVVSLNTKGCVGVRAILEIKGVCNRNRVSHEIYEEGVFKSKKGELKLLYAQSYKVEALR